MHGFLKIDGVEDFDSIVFLLQELSAFDEDAALGERFVKTKFQKLLRQSEDPYKSRISDDRPKFE